MSKQNIINAIQSMAEDNPYIPAFDILCQLANSENKEAAIETAAKLSGEIIKNLCESFGATSAPDPDPTELVTLPELTSRAINALRNRGIMTIGDVLRQPYTRWYRIPGFGKGSAQSLENAMHAAGYTDFIIPHIHPRHIKTT